jgi:hypothetical protein
MKKKLLILFIGLYLFNINSSYNLGSYIDCGGTSFPEEITILSRTVVIFLQVVTPIGLIILGSLDIMKAVTANNEGDIKKKQSKFVKRLAAAAIMFFVVSVVQLVVSISADNNEGKDFSKCLDCMINDNSSCGEVMSAPESDYPEQGEIYVPDPDFEQPELESNGDDEE